jgi:glycosyltransferase involved in cell wall biosynthesis
VLDLPAVWWRTVETLWTQESERWPGAMGAAPPLEPAWKKRRKDEELGLAEVVSVASSYTRESLERVGCTKPIVTTPYPFPTERFRARPEAPSGPFTVLAVGALDLRKGTPYLLEAWRLAGLVDARLRLIGSSRLTRGFLDRYAGAFEHLAWLPRARLEQEYQTADLLAFPTLGDGFGLVLQEAMCCGTPVLTTRCGGGPECITSGEDGLIVQERSVEALVEALRWSAANRDRLGAMGRAARRRAEAYTAAEFGPRLVGGLRAALARARGRG